MDKTELKAAKVAIQIADKAKKEKAQEEKASAKASERAAKEAQKTADKELKALEKKAMIAAKETSKDAKRQAEGIKKDIKSNDKEAKAAAITAKRDEEKREKFEKKVVMAAARIASREEAALYYAEVRHNEAHEKILQTFRQKILVDLPTEEIGGRIAIEAEFDAHMENMIVAEFNRSKIRWTMIDATNTNNNTCDSATRNGKVVKLLHILDEATFNRIQTEKLTLAATFREMKIADEAKKKVPSGNVKICVPSACVYLSTRLVDDDSAKSDRTTSTTTIVGTTPSFGAADVFSITVAESYVPPTATLRSAALNPTPPTYHHLMTAGGENYLTIQNGTLSVVENNKNETASSSSSQLCIVEVERSNTTGGDGQHLFRIGLGGEYLVVSPATSRGGVGCTITTTRSARSASEFDLRSV